MGTGWCLRHRENRRKRMEIGSGQRNRAITRLCPKSRTGEDPGNIWM